MFNEKLEEFLEIEVEKRLNDKIKEYQSISNELSIVKESLNNLILENKELSKLKNKLTIIKSFTEKINIDNIEQLIISMLYEKSDDIELNGMNSEYIPKWFSILTHYHEKKDEIFKLFDIFNIEYPQYSKQFKLPNYYNKQELLKCLNNCGKLYVTNGEMFKFNMGFYFRQFNSDLFNLDKVLKNNSYISIPFQLLLKNRLIVEDDEIFNLMVELIKNDRLHSSHFLKIVEYQNLPYEKIKKLLQVDENGKIKHKTIIKNYPKLLKEYDIANSLKEGASTNKYDELYILKFNKDIQLEFFLGIKDINLMNKIFELIHVSDEFTSLEKSELIGQCYLNITNRENV